MKNIFICADGGCYGHFLAVMLRLAYDPNYVKENQGQTNFISSAGAVNGSRAGVLLEYIKKQGVELTGEKQQTIDEIVKLYNDESFVKNSSVVDIYDRAYCHIALGHYLRLETVKKLLSVPDLKIVYVTFDQKDCKLIAKNKITKNFDPENPDISELYRNFLASYKVSEDYIQEFDSARVSGIVSDKLRNKFLELWELRMRTRVPNTIKVRQEIKDNRVLIIRMDEILKDRDQFLNKLTTFVQKEPNNELIDFYEKFKSAQQMYHMYQV